MLSVYKNICKNDPVFEKDLSYTIVNEKIKERYMKNKLKFLAGLLALTVAVSACSPTTETTSVDEPTTVAETQNTDLNEALLSEGSLILKVNPEIKVNYNSDGVVTSLESKNNEALAILQEYESFENKETSLVVKELVEIIGRKGYFVEEVEGEFKQIVLEVEKGSIIPHDNFINTIKKQFNKAVNFINKIAQVVRDYVSSEKWEGDLFAVSDYATNGVKEPMVVVKDGQLEDSNYDSPYDDSGYDDSGYDDSDYDD